MSKFTDFLNLFKWEPSTDAEEEFDIDKALNENWDKIDTKLKTYIEDTNQNISDFETNTNETVQELTDLINSTQTTYKYKLAITETTSAGANITIPCYYKVGADVLDVYLNGERLILSSDDTGTDGHYREVGTSGSISNIIKTTSDWYLEDGDMLEFEVKGEYEDET